MNENSELVLHIYKDAEMSAYSLTRLLKDLKDKDNKIKKTLEDILKEYANKQDELIEVLKNLVEDQNQIIEEQDDEIEYLKNRIEDLEWRIPNDYPNEERDREHEVLGL